MAVVAPTGVAAINAGGVTMHTFFQLPLGAYVPAGFIPDSGEQLFNNKASLLRNLRFSQPKKELFQELELLVIDEVSMVRADLLDAMDAVLRFIRKKPQQPFGGLQVLFIGDLWQLPPVVMDKEWVHLKEHYESPFFFDAQVMKELQPFLIELKKIYRQTDGVFIDLLNKVRNNELDQISWHQLHEHYQPGFQPATSEGYITLSTHNNRADTINQLELSRLTSPVFRFEAEITGDFGEKAFPADQVLELRVGAQIMFIKNDKGEFRRYYNGKIGIIERLEEDQIEVRFPEEQANIVVEKETWKNIRYKLDKAKDKIEEEELGTFSQYPIRLAWAITIHKSQGLTFDKAIIDAGAAFAAGQVYVALSRLTGLNGLVLKTRIPLSAIQTDSRVISYTSAEIGEEKLEEELQESEASFVNDYFIRCFQLDNMDLLTEDWHTEIEKKTTVSKWQMLEAYKLFMDKLQAFQQVAAKTANHFRQHIYSANGETLEYLSQRTSDAMQYFSKGFEELAGLLEQHANDMKKEPRLTKYQRELGYLKEALEVRKKKMEQATEIIQSLKEGNAIGRISELIQEMNQARSAIVEPVESSASGISKDSVPVPKTKKEAGYSFRESLTMFKEGKSIDEIAKLRQLATGTIEGHLIKAVELGELEPGHLVKEEVRNLVLSGRAALGTGQLGSLKEFLGESVSYAEIKAALAFDNWEQSVRKK